MSRQSATIVDLGEYRRQRQAKHVAHNGPAQSYPPLLWCWVWLIPVAGPVMQARA